MVPAGNGRVNCQDTLNIQVALLEKVSSLPSSPFRFLEQVFGQGIDFPHRFKLAGFIAVSRDTVAAFIQNLVRSIGDKTREADPALAGKISPLTAQLSWASMATLLEMTAVGASRAMKEGYRFQPLPSRQRNQNRNGAQALRS